MLRERERRAYPRRKYFLGSPERGMTWGDYEVENSFRARETRTFRQRRARQYGCRESEDELGTEGHRGHSNEVGLRDRDALGSSLCGFQINAC